MGTHPYILRSQLAVFCRFITYSADTGETEGRQRRQEREQREEEEGRKETKAAAKLSFFKSVATARYLANHCIRWISTLVELFQLICCLWSLAIEVLELSISSIPSPPSFLPLSERESWLPGLSWLCPGLRLACKITWLHPYLCSLMTLWGRAGQMTKNVPS